MGYDVAKLEQRLAAGESLRKGEVAALAQVPVTTLDGWIKVGHWKPRYTKTLGGHRRFKADSIRELLGQLREEHGGDDPNTTPGQPDGEQESHPEEGQAQPPREQGRAGIG